MAIAALFFFFGIGLPSFLPLLYAYLADSSLRDMLQIEINRKGDLAEWTS
jgi:hypothetical protein